jgi:23S rRNA (cytidine1920-2'-O)/16S rRNA (cytidine1409-2'-O)-methyltransferase
LQRGASHVFSVDTGYGTLAWKLRSDTRVTTLERTNALHVEPPKKVDLVVLDLGWTPQRLALPACSAWLSSGHIISLIKPHYELTKEEKLVESVASGLSECAIERVLARTRLLCEELQLEILHETMSPIKGKKSSKKGVGNSEYLFLLKTTH